MPKRNRLNRGSGKRRVTRFRKGQEIWVGDLEEAKVLKLGDISTPAIKRNKYAVLAYYVHEEDGTKSWQLTPAGSDVVLRIAWVEPINPFVRKDIRKGWEG